MRPSSLAIGWSPPGQVDDRQAPHGQPARAVDHAPIRVGAAVDQRLVHRGERRWVGAVAPSRLTRPHIPHMAASLESAITDRAGLLRFFGLAVLLQPGLGLDGDVVGEVAERDVRVDQMQAPGRIGHRVQGRGAADRADLQDVGVVVRGACADVAPRSVSTAWSPRRAGHADEAGGEADRRAGRERLRGEHGGELGRAAAERRRVGAEHVAGRRQAGPRDGRGSPEQRVVRAPGR